MSALWAQPYTHSKFPTAKALVGFRVASQQLKSRQVQIRRELHAQTQRRLHGLPAWQFPPSRCNDRIYRGRCIGPRTYRSAEISVADEYRIQARDAARGRSRNVDDVGHGSSRKIGAALVPRERGPDLSPRPHITPEVGADIPTMICGRSVDARQLRYEFS